MFRQYFSDTETSRPLNRAWTQPKGTGREIGCRTAPSGAKSCRVRPGTRRLRTAVRRTRNTQNPTKWDFPPPPFATASPQNHHHAPTLLVYVTLRSAETHDPPTHLLDGSQERVRQGEQDLEQRAVPRDAGPHGAGPHSHRHHPALLPAVALGQLRRVEHVAELAPGVGPPLPGAPAPPAPPPLGDPAGADYVLRRPRAGGQAARLQEASSAKGGESAGGRSVRARRRTRKHANGRRGEASRLGTP